MSVLTARRWSLDDPVSTRAVESGLQDFFRSRAQRAERYGDAYASLWQAAGSTVAGGKMVRPRLLLSAHAALSGSVPAAPHVVEAAVAIELLHFAFLLHDDVIDADLVRRGAPNLIGVVSRQAPASTRDHWGTTAAILTGDLMLSEVYQRAARLPLSAEARSRLLDALADAIDQTVAGEYLDVGLADGVVAPDLTTILAMSTYKTAGYSFELPLRVAAILAGCDPAVEAAVGRAAAHLGLAFQLQDDLLAAFGDPALHGKDPLSDLREGKETAIIAYARMTSAWRGIAPHFHRHDLTAADLHLVRGLLVECGAQAFGRRLVVEAMEQFRVVCDDSSGPLPLTLRALLLEVARDLTGRQS